MLAADAGGAGAWARKRPQRCSPCARAPPLSAPPCMRDAVYAPSISVLCRPALACGAVPPATALAACPVAPSADMRGCVHASLTAPRISPRSGTGCSGAAARARLGHARQLGAPAAHHALKVGVRELRHELGAVGLRRGQLLLERGLKLRQERRMSLSCPARPVWRRTRERPRHGGSCSTDLRNTGACAAHPALAAVLV